MASLLGALGLVGVLFGVLSLVLGMLGAPTDLAWIWANFGFGVLLLLAAAVSSFDAVRERLASGEGRRVGKYGTSAVLGTAVSIAILAMLAFLGTRYHHRFDWSEAKLHSLSDQTQKVLDGLDREVEALALFPRLDVGQVRDLLERYAYASDKFALQIADPVERPDLLELYGIGREELGDGLVRIAYGDDSVEVKEVTEENLTNAIVKLSRSSDKVVYFLEGHNERAVEGDAAGAPEGYGRAAGALRNETYRVEKLLLAAVGEVPEDADAVIVAGPTRPFLGVERQALTRYLERGGALLALIDPRANTDLVEDVAAWGVELGDDVVVDRALALFGRATTPFAAGYDENHEITRGLRETTLFHVVRSVRKGAGADGAFSEIVFTGRDSWAERDLDRFYGEGEAEFGPGDVPGPVSVAVAGRPALPAPESPDPDGIVEEDLGEDRASRSARVAVFGDADFASNEFLEAYRNRDLFLNTVNWLLGDVEAISIRPKLARASRFQLTQAQLIRIRSLSLFVIPEAIAVLGVLTWWRRRRAPAR